MAVLVHILVKLQVKPVLTVCRQLVVYLVEVGLFRDLLLTVDRKLLLTSFQCMQDVTWASEHLNERGRESCIFT